MSEVVVATAPTAIAAPDDLDSVWFRLACFVNRGTEIPLVRSNKTGLIRRLFFMNFNVCLNPQKFLRVRVHAALSNSRSSAKISLVYISAPVSTQ